MVTKTISKIDLDRKEKKEEQNSSFFCTHPATIYKPILCIVKGTLFPIKTEIYTKLFFDNNFLSYRNTVCENPGKIESIGQM